MADAFLVGGVRTPPGKHGGARASRGLATLCVGVGQGVAMLVERP